MFSKFALAATLAASATARILKGSCPTDVAVVENFDLANYVGHWYEVARDKQFFFEQGDCSTATYTLQDDGTVLVDNADEEDGKVVNSIGKAKCSTDGSAHCYVQFHNFDHFFTHGDSNYQVLDTDYESFSVVYSCVDHPLGNSYNQLTWVLSREETLETEDLDRVNAALTSVGYGTIDSDDLH
jgi:apolipoprotein D and lipocalin family protein